LANNLAVKLRGAIQIGGWNFKPSNSGVLHDESLPLDIRQRIPLVWRHSAIELLTTLCQEDSSTWSMSLKVFEGASLR
jgi:hypothetical protein